MNQNRNLLCVFDMLNRTKIGFVEGLQALLHECCLHSDI
jgi:hypothetical protein